MPVKRRLSKIRDHRITDEAVEAFEAGDYLALHHALGLKPWEPSPLPLSIEPLGVSQGEPPAGRTLFAAAWPKAQELQRELIAAGAEMPPASRG